MCAFSVQDTLVNTMVKAINRNQLFISSSFSKDPETRDDPNEDDNHGDYSEPPYHECFIGILYFGNRYTIYSVKFGKWRCRDKVWVKSVRQFYLTENKCKWTLTKKLILAFISGSIYYWWIRCKKCRCNDKVFCKGLSSPNFIIINFVQIYI